MCDFPLSNYISEGSALKYHPYREEKRRKKKRKKKFQVKVNSIAAWIVGLTCCIKLYRASICDLTARAASPPHRTLSDPTSTCNRTMTANTKGRYVIRLRSYAISFLRNISYEKLIKIPFNGESVKKN